MRSSRPYKSPNAAMLWSLVLPGFGQLYNKDYFMGITLLGLEFLINLKSNLNLVLVNSFKGDILAAHQPVNYSWALFYPSVYGFAMWQAFNTARVNNHKLTGNEVERRTYLTGFFIGLVIGMDFGLFWHDCRYIKMLPFLDYPVFNGIVFGVVLGLVGHFIEKRHYRNRE
ncbi:hypothetical protein J1P26_15005 [Neobacillus sp. MM2021_6]|uniref:DUF5683 domain-containing protein n=1 Tax=Bacillaceae TaxID=186817 RepID=UPI001409F6B9|nr:MULTISPECIES: DUF5683 domain-containing protein [Bacillaceae]MBO0961008.1 hypothetical protein [Neobacillus sp. MM2021_6]NHC19080.1 hypothetical protein [Bacillus sp. MM2020_4]